MESNYYSKLERESLRSNYSKNDLLNESRKIKKQSNHFSFCDAICYSRFIMNKRKKIAKKYDKDFSSLKNLIIPCYKKREISANHLYVIKIDFKNNIFKLLIKI